MLSALDLAVTIGGMIIPPAFDFVKKKFVKGSDDTPERTMSSLATTNPDVLPKYVEALGKLTEAKVKNFNRDVIGVPSQWVVDLRAAIRPTVVAFGLVYFMLGMVHPDIVLDPGVRLFLEGVISSWFGSRISTSK